MQWKQTHDCEYEGNLKKVSFKLAMWFFCLIFAYFEEICTVFMSLLLTQDIGDSQKSIVAVVDTYECVAATGYHFYLLFLASIPLWFLIITFIYTYIQIRRLDNRDTNNNNLFREAKIHFGFLVLGFKREWWWWTYVIWIRKLFMYSLIANMLLSTEENTIYRNLVYIQAIIGTNLYF